jgi:hypothetical protein
MTIERTHIQRSLSQPATTQGLRPGLVRGFAWRIFKQLVWLAYDLLLPLGIVAGFFWLQAQIVQTMAGAAAMLATIMSVIFEVGLIMVWYALRDQVHRSCHQ